MQGVPKMLPRWGVPDFLHEGVPIFLGKIAWGCQISWGAKFPATTVLEGGITHGYVLPGEAGSG